jgi:hypothetical protein
MLRPVWAPEANIDKLKEWKRRGATHAWINEGVNPQTVSLFDFKKMCEAAGLGLISYPAEKVVNPGGVKVTPDYVSLKDEPVMHAMTPKDIQAQALNFESLAPGVKDILNLQGDKFSKFGPPATDATTWKNLNDAQGPFVTLVKDYLEVVFFDFYIFNRPRYDANKKLIGYYGHSNIFACIDFLLQYHPEVGVIVECSNQVLDPNSRCPTPGEWRGETYGSIIWGAKHIGFFPQRPPSKYTSFFPTYGTVNDAVPPEIVMQMAAFANFCDRNDFLFNTKGVRNSKPPFISRMYENAYELTMNLSDSKATTGGGIQYQPYEVRLYNGGKLVEQFYDQSVEVIEIPLIEYNRLKSDNISLKKQVDDAAIRLNDQQLQIAGQGKLIGEQATTIQTQAAGLQSLRQTLDKSNILVEQYQSGLRGLKNLITMVPDETTPTIDKLELPSNIPSNGTRPNS